MRAVRLTVRGVETLELRRSMIDPDRFWAKVDKSGECWEWTAYRDPRGYGFIHLGGKLGKTYLAHRVSWVLERGSDPFGFCVCHRCDNPSCVRPAHLFLGTRLDNNVDKTRKGRNVSPGLPGESNGAAKLTADDVRAIRTSVARGAELARSFGVSSSAICMIRSGKRWAHL